MNMRLLGITLLGMCILAGLIAGFFSRSIEAALTMPADNRNNAPVKTKATPSPSMPSPMPNGISMLARDTFQRPNALFWGTASDGREWSGDANSVNVFSTFENAGQISQVDDAQKTYNALIGPVSMDAEVVFSGSVNSFDSGKANIGAVVRWIDDTNWYKALIDGSQLKILRRVNGSSATLGALPFPAQGGVFYTLRLRAVGAMLFAKVWRSSNTEPSGWMLTVMDTSLSSGFGGIRVLVQKGNIVRVTSFLETTAANMI